MVKLEWTTGLSSAVRGLIPTSYPMARVAIVRIAVAEPERNRATPLAFEVNVVCAVFLAVLHTCAHEVGGALRTDEVLLSVLAGSCHIVTTVVHATKVWVLALEAHVKCAFEHREIVQVAIEAVIRIS